MQVVNLIAIPGTQCTGAVFEPLLSALRSSVPGLTVNVHELRESSVDAAAAALALKAAAPAILLGHSLGGTIALATARQYPHLVRGVITVCSNPRKPNVQQRTTWMNHLATVSRGEYEELLASMMPTVTQQTAPKTAASRTTQAELEATCLEMGLALGPATYSQQMLMQLSRGDERESAPRRRIPTLSVACDDDLLVPVDVAAEVIKGVTHGEFVQLKKGGHMVPLTQPDALAAVISPWLWERSLQPDTLNDSTLTLQTAGSTGSRQPAEGNFS